MATPDILLKRVPESVLVAFLRFWEDPALAEWTINRHDQTYKIETKSFERGTY